MTLFEDGNSLFLGEIRCYGDNFSLHRRKCWSLNLSSARSVELR